MGRSRSCRGFLDTCWGAIAFFILAGAAAGAVTSFISDGALGSHGLTGRNLLQAKTSCPVNFEFMNYTVITSQCKGPRYRPQPCCKALKDFGCPYSEQLNLLSNDCASTMFSYINLYGQYPPGLFASFCRDSKRGLECSVEQGKSSVVTADAAAMSPAALPFVFVLWFLSTSLFV